MNNKSIQYKKKISRPNGCIAGDDDKQQLHFFLVPIQVPTVEDVSPSAKDERIGNLRGASKPIKSELTQKAFGEALVLCASWGIPRALSLMNALRLQGLRPAREALTIAAKRLI